jgi:HD-GYP domain-containing protein (c-di-GMP phosphodiesterase class II)
MNELRTNAGTQFDPGVVLAFVEMLESKGDHILSGAGYNALLSI